MVPVLDVSSCVIKSDCVLDDDLKNALRDAIKPLEDVPEKQQDWHPGSDGKVLDLVHPSLFPLVYGRSRILPYGTVPLEICIYMIGEGVTIPKPEGSTGENVRIGRQVERTTYYVWSNNYQWLPCNVSFPDGENARIDSYINNLHPTEDARLYGIIEKLITRAVPLWNITTQCYGYGYGFSPDRRVWTWEIEAIDLPPPMSDERYQEDWLGWDREDAEDEWRRVNRTIIKPEPYDYKGLCYTEEHVGDKFAFFKGKDKKLQIIVKLANIHLTPEKPEYNGGSWHIEGQLNEHIGTATIVPLLSLVLMKYIVSTALYYYDNENITDSRLHFRTKVDTSWEVDLEYEQGDLDGIDAVFGFGNDKAVQEIGSVSTREGRLVAFPNGFQHRVGSFKLQDPTKPGHRKIVALFLVDPNIPIISTANVPPQQRHWWVDTLASPRGVLRERLPTELVQMVGERVEDFPIGLEEAREIRLKLMEERGKSDKEVDNAYTAAQFSFCEH